MNKADIYLRETLLEILEDGQVDKEPRPKWKDGSPAHSKFITQKVFQYDISKGEFPITTSRPTALKGAWYDIEAIYIKQTNIIEEMHPSIHNWWRDFVVKTKIKRLYKNNNSFFTDDTDEYEEVVEEQSLGATYGSTVKRYKLVDKLLKGLEENPFGRRHSINLNQEQQKIDDPQALQPCAFETLWSVREYDKFEVHKRFIDITLVQRSQDFAVTSSINPAQYTMLAMMVCNHLTYKTGIKHEVGKLLHIVQNCHVYLRHMDAVNELLDRKPTGKQPKIELICEPKDFYEHGVEDFKFTGLENIEKLTTVLEIAV